MANVKTAAAVPATDAPKPLVAADVMKSDHPLNGAFLAYVGDKEPTKRQARAFLAANPAYRTAKQA